MSYTITLAMDAGAGMVPLNLPEWNFTSNGAAMWRAAGADLATFDGQRAALCLPRVQGAIRELRQHPTRYDPLAPANQWGTRHQLIAALTELTHLFIAAPVAVVVVSR